MKSTNSGIHSAQGFRIELAVSWLALIALGATPVAAQTDRYVSVHTGRDINGVGLANDCTNLGFGPCRTIAHALSQAGNFDVIKLGTGTYVENIVFGGGYLRPITIEGGWSSSFSQRFENPAAFTTVRGSGSGPVFDLEARGTILLITIDGITIENGNASEGGAIRALSRNDPGDDYGGSLELTVKNCRIQDNQATDGAGIWLKSDYNIWWQRTNFLGAVLSNNVFQNNVATGKGGALYGKNQSASLLVHLFDNEFLGNTAAQAGALMLISEDPDAVVTVEMARNRVVGNSATQYVPAVELKADVYSRLEAELENNIIAGNGNGEGGGSLHVLATRGGSIDIRLLNDTIADNSGIGLYLSTSGEQIIAGATNVIIQDNPTWDVLVGDTASLGVGHSNIGSVHALGTYNVGSGVYDAPTSFVSPENGDYHLSADATEIDAGVCGALVNFPPIPPQYIRIAPLTDFEGDLREPFLPPSVDGCDIGADEFIPGSLLPTVNVTADPSYVAIGESSVVSWTSTNAFSCNFRACAIGGLCSVSSATPTGSRTVSPSSDALYEVECFNGAFDSASDSVTVFVPEPSSALLGFAALAPLWLLRRLRGHRI